MTPGSSDMGHGLTRADARGRAAATKHRKKSRPCSQPAEHLGPDLLSSLGSATARPARGTRRVVSRWSRRWKVLSAGDGRLSVVYAEAGSAPPSGNPHGRGLGQQDP